MQFIKKPLILTAIGAISFLLLGYSYLNQKRAFVYKQVPKKYVANLSDTDGDISNVHSVYDLTQSLPANYVQDGSVDYTKNLQDGINNHQNIAFPNFPVLINTSGLSLKSNTSVVFKRRSKVLLQGNALPSYTIIKIYNLQNVKIYSMVVVGDRSNHQGTTGEGGMGIKISGSTNIQLFSPKVSNCWGDGIYIANDPNTVSDGIVIQNAQLDYNRRNGLTVTGGKNITISNALVSNTYGTPPMAGIDIEPNNYKAVLDNINISNYTSFNNSISALQLGLSNLPGPVAKSVNITVNGLVSIDSYCGVIVGGLFDKPETKKIDGNIELNNIKVVNADLPIKVAKNYDKAPAIHLRRIKFVRSNASGSEDSQDNEVKKLKSRISNRVNISME